MLPADVCRCVGRTGYKSDDKVCPIRGSCKRHTDIPSEPVNWAMHLCRTLQNESYIPTGEESCLT